MRPVPVPTLDTLAADPTVFKTLPPEVQDQLYEQVAILEIRLRVSKHGPRVEPNPAQLERDILLTAEEAAKIAGVKPAWLLRHAKLLPFARKLSHKMVRYSEVGLRKWLASRRP